MVVFILKAGLSMENEKAFALRAPVSMTPCWTPASVSQFPPRSAFAGRSSLTMKSSI